MFDRLSQRSQAERLADDEAMERQREHKRVPLGLLQHLLELIDDHISELAAGMIAVHQRAGIIQFHRIGNGQERP